MALNYTTANSGLFVRFGVLAGACRDIVALKGGSATTNVGANASLGARGVLIEQNAAASPTQYPLVDGIWTLINSARSSMSGATQSLSSMAQSLFIDQVNQDSPLTSKDLTSALKEVIRQMRATSDSINGSTVSLGSQTAFGTATGDPIIVGTLKATSGYTLQTPFAESVKFVCTGDAASGATARNETLSANGKPANTDVFSDAYPAGSGGSASLTLADAKKNNTGGNKLQNSSFETFTTADYPDNWVIALGTAGTQVTANGSGYTGANAVKINGDSGGTLTCLRQSFGTTATTTAGTGGTPGTLAAATRYAVNYYIKSPSVPAAGVLRIRLVDGSNAVINDDAGNANSFTLTLSGISTSYVSHTGVFVTPTVMPSSYKIEVALTTAITDTKALALTTKIATPTGWSTMGELQVGDRVFDENGIPCNVVHTTEVMRNHKCHNVRFSDGSVITADAGHQWVVKRTYQGGKRTGTKKPLTLTMTTEQINESMKADANVRYSIPVAKPLQTEGIALPIDPYVLGAWLGDGDSKGSGFTCHDKDKQIVAEIEAAGIHTNRHASSMEKCGRYTIGGQRQWGVRRKRKWSGGRKGGYNRVGTKPLSGVLKELDLINNKHIPSVYLRSSYQQRMALMQGLMDTDGTIHKTSGMCKFTTVKPALRDGVFELAASLGLKPNIRTNRAMIYGVDHGEAYDIVFMGYKDEPVFRLERKKALLKDVNPDGFRRSQHRWIMSTDECDSVPVKCIQVDSPSHLYLAGEAMIPTHNCIVIDDLCLTPMTQLYTGGPAFAAFAGSTSPVRNDTWTVAVSNTVGVIADYLERMFALRAKGLIVPYNDAGGETIADTLAN